MHEMMILLPDRIPILRSRRNPSIPVDPESYSLYFDNFIYPLRPEYDVLVQCDYGGNFGDCWRIDAFPEDVDHFPLVIRVYDEWGRKLCEKSCTVELIERAVRPGEYRILCLGDSMTHRHVYVDHMALKLANLKTIGTRSFNGGVICHEGRGGWQLTHYVSQYADWWGGSSPFVFPEGFSAREYYGDKSYNERLKTPDLDSYSLDGYTWSEIKEEQLFHDDGKLWRHTTDGDILAEEHPRWAFSFSKYLERFELDKPDAVSILLAANDLQNTPYEDAAARILQFMNELEIVIASVHKADPEIDVIVNLPIGGAEQFAWGLRGNGSAKRYRLNTMLLCKDLLERWDRREAEHVHICPMRCFLDPANGFDTDGFRPNPHSARLSEHHSNWVHPNSAGYRQMGDALASMVERLRQNKQSPRMRVSDNQPSADAPDWPSSAAADSFEHH